MELNEAKAIIVNVCSTFRGTLADHRKIQEALRLVFSDKPKDPKEGEPKK